VDKDRHRGAVVYFHLIAAIPFGNLYHHQKPIRRTGIRDAYAAGLRRVRGVQGKAAQFHLSVEVYHSFMRHRWIVDWFIG
jgi:hypothetical protein